MKYRTLTVALLMAISTMASAQKAPLAEVVTPGDNTCGAWAGTANNETLRKIFVLWVDGYHGGRKHRANNAELDRQP